MSAIFLNIMAERRTIYELNNVSPVSDDRIQDLLKHALLHVPSAFNSQTTRVVLLVKEDHIKLWQITKDIIKAKVPAEAWPASDQRLSRFQAGYATILFFNDQATVRAMQQNFTHYADKFPGWAKESNGMHQYAIWTILEAEGLGANLQHYNPLIDQEVQDTWRLSSDWELQAQLVIGTSTGDTGDKAFSPIGERLKVFGA